MSSSLTGPLTFLMMDLEVSSRNSTRTWVTPPRDPVRPRTLMTRASLTGCLEVWASYKRQSKTAIAYAATTAPAPARPQYSPDQQHNGPARQHDEMKVPSAFVRKGKEGEERKARRRTMLGLEESGRRRGRRERRVVDW
jgi:hypothetical protein